MDFIRIIPVQRFTGIPAPENRLYAFYADAFSLHGRTIAECYRLVKGLSLPPKAGYYQKENRTPYLWRESDQDWDSPLMKIRVSKSGEAEFTEYPLEWLEQTKFVVLGVTLEEADKSLDVFPATWRAIAYIISDSRRMNAQPLSWQMSPTEYDSARIHALFREQVHDRGLLAERYSKEELGLTEFERLPDPKEELEYYHYLSANSLFTDEIIKLFGLSYRCWHGCGYLGWPGFPICRFFLLRNQMIKDMKILVLSGRDRLLYNFSQG